MIIAPVSGGITGRWLRINYHEVSVNFFGARDSGTSTQDNTEPIQAAIDFAADRGGGVVLIPEGTYYVTQLTLKTGVSIKGEFA